jgi:trehalose-6-phosphate synthase/trehalose-6-phosphatase
LPFCLPYFSRPQCRPAFSRRFGFFGASGPAVSWETLPDGRPHLRSAVIRAHGSTVEGVWGEEDNVLEAAMISAPFDAAAAAGGSEDVRERLRTLFGGASNKMFMVTDVLPLRLRATGGTDGTPRVWTARWIEDDIRARTANSIADDINTIWLGIVTRECIEFGAEGEAEPDTPIVSSCAVGTEGPIVPSPQGLSRPLILAPIGGGRGDLDFTDLETQFGARIPIAGEGAGSEDPASVTVHSLLTDGDREAITRALNAINTVPVFLPAALHARASEYAQAVLKPCMHNVLETGSQRIAPQASNLEFQSAGWAAFCAVNRAVARTVMALFGRDDIAWIHDYGLGMLPTYLADAADAAFSHPAAMVFYMHAPFPTSEIFRTLHVRDELLHSFLRCDMVGFHTFNYARHFLHAAKRLLGIPSRTRRGGSLTLDVEGREVLVAISHVGVEAGVLDSWMASREAAVVAAQFAAKHPGKVIIAGIDSCQRLSGVALKLLAFEKLLSDNVVYRRKVVLVQRCEVRGALARDAEVTSRELRERVADINATYSAEAGGPVVDYEERPYYSPQYRVGLFHRADVLLQTPIREGLNMLALEYTYVRTQWQIARSKAVAERAEATARTAPPLGSPARPLAGEGASGSGQRDSPTDSLRGGGSPAGGGGSDSPTPSGGAFGLGEGSSDVTGGFAAPATESLKTMYGMPEHYATLAAPPSLRRSGRSALAGVFSDTPPSPGAGGRATRPAEWSRSALTPVAGAASEAVGSFGAAAVLDASLLRPAAFVPLPPPDRGGCVILSEFSMAANILNSNLHVNPWNIRTVAAEVDKSLLMEDHERSFRQWRDYKYAIANPSAAWSRSCIADVVEVRGEREAERQAASGLSTLHGTGGSVAGFAALGALASPTAASGSSFSFRAPAPAALDATVRGVATTPVPVPRCAVPVLDVTEVVRAFRSASRRVLFLDYGGTLVGRELGRSGTSGVSYKQDFHLDGYSACVPPPVMDALTRLTRAQNNTVYVVSGLRSTAVDVLNVSSLPRMGLAAENGMYVSPPAEEGPQSPGPATPPGRPALSRAKSVRSSALAVNPVGRQWTNLLPPESDAARLWETLKARASSIATEYAWRVNGSAVRLYDSLLVWDYRNADAEWARAQATFLAGELEAVAEEAEEALLAARAALAAAAKGGAAASSASPKVNPVQVSVRKSRVEFALRDMNKGRLVSETLRGRQAEAGSPRPDFVLCVGDDTTDEDMFKAGRAWAAAQEGAGGVPPTVFMVTVGRKASTAASAYCVDVPAVHALVCALAQPS